MSIEPSDAECGLLQLTPASRTVKSTFLFESLGFLGPEPETLTAGLVT